VSPKRNTPPTGGNSLIKQVGQGLDKVLSKINSRSSPASPPPASPKELSKAATLTLCWQLEEIFLYHDEKNPWPKELLKFVLAYSNLSWGFLTEILVGDPNHYVIIAGQPLPSSLDTRQPMSSGLAGYVHSQAQPLAITSIKSVEELPFIFYPGDPLKKAATFYAWPLIYNGAVRGSLLLAGKANQILDDEAIHFLDFVALRLSSHYQQFKLLNWVLELNQLETQTALPHRTYFIDRLERLIEAHKQDGVTLTLLNVSGFGRYALSFGQAEAAKLLKELANVLLERSAHDWELGHLSYGLFGIAAPSTDKFNLDDAIVNFQRTLSQWSIPTRTGRINFVFHRSEANFPSDGQKSESLLEVALSNLAASS
jgi:GGDEF domain-containing protein